jgi:hypothetical protein
MQTSRRRQTQGSAPPDPETAQARPSATPKPDPRFLNGRLAPPTADDFEAWCENPVTQYVATVHALICEVAKDTLLQEMWVNGQANQVALDAARTRVDAYKAFLETPRETYAEHIKTFGRR